MTDAFALLLLVVALSMVGAILIAIGVGVGILGKAASRCSPSSQFSR